MNLIPYLFAAALSISGTSPAEENSANLSMNDKVEKSEAEWKKLLSPEQYYVLRRKGTERPFGSALNHIHDHGIFKCACGKELFSSEAKFDSGTGWPSFYQPISKDAVETKEDRSFFSTRTEVLCERCGGHLGHVFNDGPQPTGLRHCMNGVALNFEKTP